MNQTQQPNITQQDARWYCVDSLGNATLCASWEDARYTARETQQIWPELAPCVVAKLVVCDGGAA